MLIIDAMGSATRYQYGDVGGLRAIVSPDGQVTQLEYDAESRLLKITDPLGRSTHYDYDKAGRLQSRTDANGHALAYRYDKLGRLISLRNENHCHYLFEYDEGGRVIAETGFDGAVTSYRYDPLAQVHTDAIQGVKVPAWNQYNPYDPERDPLLQAGPEPAAPHAVYYYHADHLGTPQALTDAQGQLALEMDYQAWGEAREVIAEAAASAGIRNPFRFQGQYHDDESGLHYNRYRYYDPEIGRFISRDPIGLFGGLNNFIYAANPIEWIDALGLINLRATDPARGSLSPIQTRCWYLREEERIDQKLCQCKSQKERARLAHKLRNEARIRARLLSNDSKWGIGLYVGGEASGTGRAEPMLKWKDAIARAKAKGANSPDEIYKVIEESSKKSRASVNKSLEGVDCNKELKGF
ncbi:RHS repeat domain-containing protein [Aquitalea magnusonii]|uniref:RHS repeat domain-containing protein n=1 Tax=Aquitalea magnusonii TaxID=332411 RepID=UPI000B5CE864|nr:RHS repeat-associated core domain-containing protein [Aquitalea magnusonii]